MTRDSAVAIVAALGCHALVLFGFQGPTFHAEKSEGSDSYMEVSLIESAARTVKAEAPQVVPVVPAPVIPVEPVPEPIKPDPKPEPTTEPPKEVAITLPAEPTPPARIPPVQEVQPLQPVQSGTSETKATEIAPPNLPNPNNSSFDQIKNGKLAEPSVRQIAASYVKYVKPIYPAEAKRLKQEGQVLVRIYINASGKIDKVEIMKSSNFPLLDRAALEAAKRSRLRPAYVGDRPINSKVEAPYRFVLKE